MRFSIDRPSAGNFTTGINSANKNSELVWTLVSLPLYMVCEIGRILDLKQL